MDKKLRPTRSRNQVPKAPASEEAPGDRPTLDLGGLNNQIWVNERGEVCYGNECFTVAIDTDRNEVRVSVKGTAACEIDPLVDALRDVLGKGARTVFEVETELKES